MVDDPAREQLTPALVESRDVRALAMQVDADRIHRWASFDPDSSCARWHSAPGTGALGGPLLHGIRHGSYVTVAVEVSGAATASAAVVLERSERPGSASVSVACELESLSVAVRHAEGLV